MLFDSVPGHHQINSLQVLQIPVSFHFIPKFWLVGIRLGVKLRILTQGASGKMALHLSLPYRPVYFPVINRRRSHLTSESTNLAVLSQSNGKIERRHKSLKIRWSRKVCACTARKNLCLGMASCGAR
jgi:hypothetical protein